MRCSLILFAILFSNSLWAKTLSPFETDYCTMFREGPSDSPELWKHCCLEHDLRYWVGGRDNEQDKSDLQLKACVNEVAGPNWARLIYYGVRMGHWSPIKSKYKWGWGWKPFSKFSEITPQDIEIIKEELERSTLSKEVIEKFLKENFPETK